MIFAGKAHPATSRQGTDRQYHRLRPESEFGHHIIFFEDYDLSLSRHLVQGVDVWLNNPLYPLEASGTTGMKAGINGVLNLSVLDGWWDEGYDGRNGWAIPSADDGTLDPEKRDEFEGRAIFDLLENEVVPMFDERSDGLPRRWIGMVRHAVSKASLEVDAVRMVRDYVERLYVPVARGLMALPGNGGPAGLADWKERVRNGWSEVAVRGVETAPGDGRVGERLAVRATVALGDLTPADVAVVAVSGRVGDDDRLEDGAQTRLEPAGTNGAPDAYVFEGEIPLEQAGSFGYAVRVVPHHAALATPAELGLVVWA